MCYRMKGDTDFQMDLAYSHSLSFTVIKKSMISIFKIEIRIILILQVILVYNNFLVDGRNQMVFEMFYLCN